MLYAHQTDSIGFDSYTKIELELQPLQQEALVWTTPCTILTTPFLFLRVFFVPKHQSQSREAGAGTRHTTET